MNSAKHPKTKRESVFLSLILNIIIPSIVMMKGNQWFDWTPVMSLVLALSFPIGYGIYDFSIRRKYNFISILGFVSILLTGGIGLLHLPKEWIAAKEAAIPLLIGVVVLGSLKTRYPLIRTLLFNPEVIDTDRIEARLKESGNTQRFNTHLTRATYMLSSSFLLSAVLNYGLAKAMIKSETGTTAFTEELGRMNIWTYPVIVLPCTLIMVGALIYLLKGVHQLTGLKMEDVIRSPENTKATLTDVSES